VSSRIDLIWLGGASAPEWPRGRVYLCGRTPGEVAEVVARRASSSGAEAWLFRDSALGTPPAGLLDAVLARPGDVWHAGLCLGMKGLPGRMDFVQPTWVFNRDPEAAMEATSWRLSLRTCLLRRDVLVRMGGPAAGFESLDAAGLELGHRYLTRGVLVRHCPALLQGGAPESRVRLPWRDEWLFLLSRFGLFWTLWAAGRSLMNGEMGIGALRALAAALRSFSPRPDPAPYRFPAGGPAGAAPVTAVVPTVDRYPYLRQVLRQLGDQTVRPVETLVVDQTPADRRERLSAEEFPGIGLQVIQLDEAGQCSSRNTALEAVRSGYVLLLDDDIELPPDLIEQHLAALEQTGADVSCGICHEPDAGPLPASFRLMRASDVFPAGNLLLRTQALSRSGLFDLAYNRGQRADCDLGMRLTLSGALAVLNPQASVLHHHAPRGGLRVHRARVVTYGHSRNRVWKRVAPSVSEIYLARRYYQPRQVREMLWIAAAGTLQARGGLGKRVAKALFGLLSLPLTVSEIRRNSRGAEALLRNHPRIPLLSASRLPLARMACE